MISQPVTEGPVLLPNQSGIQHTCQRCHFLEHKAGDVVGDTGSLMELGKVRLGWVSRYEGRIHCPVWGKPKFFMFAVVFSLLLLNNQLLVGQTA